MNLHFLNSKEKKKLLAQLNDQFGVQDLPFSLLESGKEKLRAFSGNISKDEIIQISKAGQIELIGLYFLKQENYELRLSFDATQLLSSYITNNIIDINEEQYQSWMKGNDLDIKTDKGIFIIKHKQDFLGCGKSTGERILNHVPKDRRLKK